MTDPTQRFSTRVQNYVQYRPRYPKEILSILQSQCGLRRDSVIADMGSGTGFLAEIFLANGNQVFGIEPNGPMREAGERLLGSYPAFASIDATAEATTLPDHSVDFITAGQAFHWFDRQACRKEFQRILRPTGSLLPSDGRRVRPALHRLGEGGGEGPGGWVVLIWNDRRTESTPFLRAYEQLLHRFATDYQQVDHKQVDTAAMREFFRREPIRKTLPNFQEFDLPSLKGRLLSSSYVPDAGQPGYDQMLTAVEHLFTEHNKQGRVTFEYDTVIYCGRL